MISTKTTANGKEQAQEWYDRLRPKIETADNVGKLVSIDLSTGNYAIGDDYTLTAPRSLRARNPNADVFTLRIGYKTVYALGGVVEPNAQ